MELKEAASRGSILVAVHLRDKQDPDDGSLRGDSDWVPKPEIDVARGRQHGENRRRQKAAEHDGAARHLDRHVLEVSDPPSATKSGVEK